jgi:hydroxyethylthiazole kinase
MVVAVTGPVDSVTDGATLLEVQNGHPLMGRITGSGCTATAILGAFAAVCPSALEAAAGALAVFGLAGEKAAQGATLPGSFSVQLLDMLAAVTPEDVRAGARCAARRLP